MFIFNIFFPFFCSFLFIEALSVMFSMLDLYILYIDTYMLYVSIFVNSTKRSFITCKNSAGSLFLCLDAGKL